MRLSHRVPADRLASDVERCERERHAGAADGPVVRRVGVAAALGDVGIRQVVERPWVVAAVCEVRAPDDACNSMV